MAKVNLKILKKSRQNLKRREQNRSLKNEIKTHFSKFLSALKQKDRNKADEYSRIYISSLDKAVKKNVLHRNNAARHKSKAMKLLSGFVQEKVKEPAKVDA